MSLPKIVIDEPLPRIFHARFKSQRPLCSTFMRIQEYYESPNPKFRGHYFTKDEYAQWYAELRGSFSYYEDWGGFNVPGNIVRDFHEGKFDPLSAREKHLLETLLSYENSLFNKPFYLIGTCGRAVDVAHEVAHGLWYLSKDYKNRMMKQLDLLPAAFKKRFFKSLGEGGYCQEVLLDELQAYIITDERGYWFSEHSLDLQPFAKTVSKMLTIFLNFTSGHLPS